MTERREPAYRRYLRFWGPNVEGDVDDELRFHLEMRVAEYVARGLSPEEARARAERRFGDAAPVRDECLTIGHRRRRSLYRTEMMRTLAQDLRGALRAMRRQPLPLVIALLCLALGIGTTTTVFSVANTLLLRPLPFPNGERMVTVSTLRENRGRLGVSSYEDFADWRARNRSLADAAALRRDNFTFQSFSTGDGPQRLGGTRATASLWRVLGVEAERGRLFGPDDDRPGAPSVVVVARGLADRLLGGADKAVGATMSLNGRTHTVIGVLPERWRYPESSEFWVPLAKAPDPEQRGNRSFDVVATLRSEATLDAARRDLTRLMAEMARENPEHDTNYAVRVDPMRDRYVGEAKPAFLLMGGAALLVLLVACANVATLQLARAAARAREVAVRSALGASRARLVGQLLTESLVLAVAGGALGVLLAVYGSELLARSVAGGLPPWMTFGVDLRVLAFTLVVSAACGIAFGLAPAFRLTAGDAARALRDGGRGGMDLTRGRLYRGLVGAEVALSVVLLTGAALAVQSFRRLARAETGFDGTGVAYFSASLQGHRYEDAAGRVRYVDDVLRAVRAIPGVRAAGATSHIPVGGCCSRFGFRVEGQETPAGQMPMATGSLVTPGYFRALGIALVRGRDFAETDVKGTTPVAVVSETFASTYWPGEDAIGKRIHLGSDLWTVIGVVRDVRQASLLDAPEPQFYRAHAQDAWDRMTIAVRAASGTGATLIPELRRAARAADPSLPPYDFDTMSDMLSSVVAARRLYGVLFSAFAIVAIALATAGVYGVAAYYVAQRTGEIGIRMALGATRGRVLTLVVRQGAVVGALGVAAGLAGSAAANRWLASILYGIRPSEPVVAFAVAAVLGLTVIVATYLPARRACGIDPARAIRAE